MAGDSIEHQGAPVQQDGLVGGKSENMPEQPKPTKPALTASHEDEHQNTDDRDVGNWDSRYPKQARWSIRWDAAYVASILALTFTLTFLTWSGVTFQFLAGDCTTCSEADFRKFSYWILGGLLGGTLYGLKWLYNVVARGYWNIDRRLWRLFSPWLSAGLALAVGTLTDSGVFGLTTKATAGSAFFSLGFVAGYFADSALRKMKEIADTVFGSPEKHEAHSSMAPKK